MAEVDAAKEAGDGKAKDYQGMWGFFQRIWDTVWSGPVTKTLLIGGFVLLILFAVGGIPKVESFTSSQSRNVLVLGVLAIASSVAMQLVRSVRFESKFGRFSRFFPFIMLMTGIFSIAVVTLSHFGILTLPKSDSLRADLDEVVIGLALASWCGFIPAYLSARQLEAIPLDIKSQIETLSKQQEQLLIAVGAESTKLLGSIPTRIDEELTRLKASEADFLNHLKESESELVNHVEDATRAMLKGVDEVFARALSMITEAQDELILVNFAMNFGSPHRYNQEVVDNYARRHKGANFAKDVGTFFSQLKGKVASLPSVQILTVSDEGASNNFLTPLSLRPGYEALQRAFSSEQSEGNKTRGDIAFLVDHESSDCESGRAPKCMLEVESLPIQLLIAGLPRRGGSPRSGCLVFMVGTEMLQTGLDTGSEPAFYTELDNMVVVFKRLAHSLMEAARTNNRQMRVRR
jgi:hypothetical protein